jgi:molybdopterin synthase sulfur carrier subunit
VAEVIVRYFAGARAAAGTATERVALTEGSSVEDVLTVLRTRHGARLTGVLTASSLLLDEVAVRDRTQRPVDGAVLDVLPPFAGG